MGIIFVIMQQLIIANVGVLFTFFSELINFNLKNIETTLKSLQNPVQIQTKSKSTLSYNENFYKTVVGLKSIYLMIYEISEMVNKCMGKKMLLLMLLYGMSFIIGGYRGFQALVSVQTGKGYILSLVLCVISFAGLTNIVLSAEKCTKTVCFRVLFLIIHRRNFFSDYCRYRTSQLC